MKNMRKIALFSGLLIVAMANLHAKPFIKPKVIELVNTPDEEAVIITYYGSTFLSTVLFKVNNQTRETYYEDTFAGLFSQMKSFGFSVKVNPGDVNLEMRDVKAQKCLNVICSLPKGKYEFLNEKGKIRIINEADKTEMPVTIRDVERYQTGGGDKAILVIDKVDEYSPVIFRINDAMPQEGAKLLLADYSFSSLEAGQEIEISTGDVKIEYGIYQKTLTKYNAPLSCVNTIRFKAEKGKRYKIETVVTKDKKEATVVSNLVELE